MLDPAGHKEKTARNRIGSADVLRARGVAFESKNRGAHLIVRADSGVVVDFWPGTGQWIPRPPAVRTRGRGVFPLLRYLGVRGPTP